MKSRRVSVAAMMLLFCVAVGFGEDMKPNFTGDWTLDREKSEMGEGPRGGGGRGRGMGISSLSIAHEGDTLVMKRKVEFQGEERTFESRHTIDGKESVNEGFRGNSIKSKTRWEGTTLVTESVMESQWGTRNQRGPKLIS
jgi:hypothetical protein